MFLWHSSLVKLLLYLSLFVVELFLFIALKHFVYSEYIFFIRYNLYFLPVCFKQTILKSRSVLFWRHVAYQFVLLWTVLWVTYLSLLPDSFPKVFFCNLFPSKFGFALSMWPKVWGMCLFCFFLFILGRCSLFPFTFCFTFSSSFFSVFSPFPSLSASLSLWSQHHLQTNFPLVNCPRTFVRSVVCVYLLLDSLLSISVGVYANTSLSW